MNSTVHAISINIESNEIERLKAEVLQLKLQLKGLRNQLFGSTFERLDSDQNELFEQGALVGKPEHPLDSDAQSEREEEKSVKAENKKW